jgi:hypothetical protein
MLHSVWNSFFGCGHTRTTFPITPKRSATNMSATRVGTYVACLDCGRELEYDWKSMRVGEPVKTADAPPQPEPVSHPAFRAVAAMATSLIRR